MTVRTVLLSLTTKPTSGCFRGLFCPPFTDRDRSSRGCEWLAQRPQAVRPESGQSSPILTVWSGLGPGRALPCRNPLQDASPAPSAPLRTWRAGDCLGAQEDLGGLHLPHPHLAPSSSCEQEACAEGHGAGSAEERPFTARAASPPTSAKGGRALVVLPDLDSRSSDVTSTGS